MSCGPLFIHPETYICSYSYYLFIFYLTFHVLPSFIYNSVVSKIYNCPPAFYFKEENMKKHFLIPFIFAGLVLSLSCSKDSGVDSGDDTAPAGKVTVVDSSCSECGGFAKITRGEADDTPVGEHLAWSYDSATELLTIEHNGLVLNCCGIHTVSAEYSDGIVTILEDDQPTPEGRCRCECSYDFMVSLQGLQSDAITIGINLTVDQSTVVHWSGEINLVEGAGVVIL